MVFELDAIIVFIMILSCIGTWIIINKTISLNYIWYGKMLYGLGLFGFMILFLVGFRLIIGVLIGDIEITPIEQ